MYMCHKCKLREISTTHHNFEGVKSSHIIIPMVTDIVT